MQAQVTGSGSPAAADPNPALDLDGLAAGRVDLFPLADVVAEEVAVVGNHDDAVETAAAEDGDGGTKIVKDTGHDAAGETAIHLLRDLVEFLRGEQDGRRRFELLAAVCREGRQLAKFDLDQTGQRHFQRLDPAVALAEIPPADLDGEFFRLAAGRGQGDTAVGPG